LRIFREKAVAACSRFFADFFTQKFEKTSDFLFLYKIRRIFHEKFLFFYKNHFTTAKMCFIMQTLSFLGRIL